MYIIMYKYSTFKIKRKSFRSSMSKNFPVIPGLLPRHPRLRPGNLANRRGITLFLPYRLLI